MLLTIVFSGNSDGHQLFNEDEVLLHTRDILSRWRHGSRIWGLWLTGQQPCRLTLQRIYFVVQKKKKEHRRKKKTAMKQNSQDISMWMSCVQSSLFSVILAVVLEQTKVVLDLCLQVHCVRDMFSQQPYSVERCVNKHFLDSRRVLSSRCFASLFWKSVLTRAGH